MRRRALLECACAWIRRIFKLTNRINCRCVRETRPGSTVRHGLPEAHHSETQCRNWGLEKLTRPRIIEADPDYLLTVDLSCFILPTGLLTNTLLSFRVSEYITRAKKSRLSGTACELLPKILDNRPRAPPEPCGLHISWISKAPTAPMPHIVNQSSVH